MEIKIKIDKKHVFFLTFLIVALGGVIFVMAQPVNPGHTSSQIFLPNIGNPRLLDTWSNDVDVAVSQHENEINNLQTAVTNMQLAPSFVHAGQGTKVVSGQGGVWLDLFTPTDFGLIDWTDTYLVEISDIHSPSTGLYHMSASFLVSMTLNTNDNRAYSIPSSTSAHASGANGMEFRFLARTGQVPGVIQVKFDNSNTLPTQVNIPYKIIRINRF